MRYATSDSARPSILFGIFTFIALVPAVWAEPPERKQPSLTLAARHGNQFGLLTLSLDGQQGRLVTVGTMPLVEPAWSPDGKSLAFVSFEKGPGQICVLDVNTQKVTKLTDQQDWERNPTWSPDGKKLAFTSRRDGHEQIYLMNADGSQQTNISNNTGFDADPTWSPNGTQIAFASSREGRSFRLFVMNADGSKQQALSEQELLGWLFPDWSPDGNWIAVGRRENEGVTLSLFNLKRRDFVEIPNEAGCNTFARWSPDGRYIAFAHFTEPPASYRPNDPLESMPSGDLMLFDGDTSTLQVIAKEAVPGWGPRPSWEPPPRNEAASAPR